MPQPTQKAHISKHNSNCVLHGMLFTPPGHARRRVAGCLAAAALGLAELLLLLLLLLLPLLLRCYYKCYY